MLEKLAKQTAVYGISTIAVPKQVEFRALRRSAPLKVALMLPMAVKSTDMELDCRGIVGVIGNQRPAERASWQNFRLCG